MSEDASCTCKSHLCMHLLCAVVLSNAILQILLFITTETVFSTVVNQKNVIVGD